MPGKRGETWLQSTDPDVDRRSTARWKQSLEAEAGAKSERVRDAWRKMWEEVGPYLTQYPYAVPKVPN